MASQRCTCLSPKSCDSVNLQGKGDIANVIKVRILREGDSQIIWRGDVTTEGNVSREAESQKEKKS